MKSIQDGSEVESKCLNREGYKVDMEICQRLGIYSQIKAGIDKIRMGLGECPIKCHKVNIYDAMLQFTISLLSFLTDILIFVGKKMTCERKQYVHVRVTESGMAIVVLTG